MSIFGLFGHSPEGTGGEEEPTSEVEEYGFEGPFNHPDDETTSPKVKGLFGYLEKKGLNPQWAQRKDREGHDRWFIRYNKRKEE